MKYVERFKLYALLMVSVVLVRRAGKSNLRVKQLLGESPFVFQILTLDGAAAYLELRNEEFKVHFGRHPVPDFSQSWKTARDAVVVMLSRDETEILRALEDGRCELQGSFLIGMWLNEAIKLARGF